MKQNVEVLAYIQTDSAGVLRALRFVDGIRIERRESGFDIRSTAATLPKDFFSPNVPHVAAIVGTNSSGKSTALQDMCRILSGNRPVAARYALVMRSNQDVYQICSHPGLVRFDGREIGIREAAHDSSPKIVFYAGGYDPLGRTKELVLRSKKQKFCDISDQFVYASDPAHDFDYKLIYLESLIRHRDPSLFLQADGGRERSICFEARSGYDVNLVARDFFEFALTYSSEMVNQPRLLAHLGIVQSEDTRDLYDVMDRKEILEQPGTHFLDEGPDYFELLYTYVNDGLRGSPAVQPLPLALATGRIVELLRAEPRDARFAESMRAFPEYFADTVHTMLGPIFFPSVNALCQAASNAGMLSADGMHISISLTGKLEKIAAVHSVVKTLINLRSEGLDFSFHFSGISEGQRTLLTFFSRLYMQAKRVQHKGSTLLLIDEHEHGLHPEWQRRYLQELITFLGQRHFAPERYQVILSTHSPFLVSDLPGTHVNKIGADSGEITPTLAANLLELLLSPLFLENTTGEFSRTKIAEFLDEVERASDAETLDSASALLPLLGDDLIRNYCKIRVEEKMRRLARRRA